MTGNPWHLEALGLPAHADAVAVRRAYATRLRQIDPAEDPASFQALRDAYQAALTWCDEHPADPHAESADASLAYVEPSDPHPSSVEAPPKDQAADDAMRHLRDAVSQIDDSRVDGLLDATLAGLRHGYIDAPGQFEDLLVDALRACRIERRAALFHAATHAFHWHEVGRLRVTDPRAAWIGRVLAQSEDWLTLDVAWRSTWLALIERAQRGMDDHTTRRWPDIGKLRERLPDWLTLHLAPSQLQTWEDAFNGLPATTRDEFQRRAAPDAATRPQRTAARAPRRRLGLPPAAWAIGWFALMLVYLIGNGIFTARQHDQGEPLPHFNEAPLTPQACMALYERFDSPDAFAGMAPADVVQAKRRAQRCALDGHWKPSQP
ncbi:hypothetical protein L2Y96_02975 [Luteibacter aegosomaticola]|uniref:hypothetical protein n=1 Tax=Luteibacter aegosomaticola TaxID=2911538 RepID=UPI001FF87D82|nr:hypothetical protein [Luteibacter aegosomaticola]UPG90753.1 hypothetical protein L2Y96_02975 [Luteibacter aegosomaticola]